MRKAVADTELADLDGADWQVIKDLQELVQRAKNIEMTADRLGEQRRSFAYGNTHIENERITREMVAVLDAQLHSKSR